MASLKLLLHYLLAVAWLIPMTLILAILIIGISLFPGTRRLTFRLASFWGWGLAKAMGLTFSIYGAEKVDPGTTYVMTPNHQGNADILALITQTPVPYLWVIKKSLLKIPFFGWALGRTGAISIDRSKSSEAMKRLQSGMGELTNGLSVLCYPEGTRSSDGQLQSFKKGAFVMAVHTGAPILPVTINGAFRVLPKKTIFFRPGHITVTFSDPIETRGMTDEDIPALMQQSRDAVLSKLDTDYDPFKASEN